MPWFLFAFLSAIFLSATSILEKRVLKKVHSIDYSASIAIVSLILSIPFLFFIDYSQISSTVLLLTLATAFLGAMAFFLVAKSTKHLDISTVSPLMALSPATTSIGAFLILGERIHHYQIIGIIFMIIGSYILTMNPNKGLLEPLKLFIHSKYIHFIFLALILYSFAAVIDRSILNIFNASIPTFLFFLHFFVMLLYLPISWFFGGTFHGIRRTIKIAGPEVVVSGLFVVLYRYFQMEALRLISVGLVSAIKRSSSFFTTLIGGELFHEDHLRRKLFASLIIISGSLLIVI